MIKYIYLLLEIFSIIFCLHSIYWKKIYNYLPTFLLILSDFVLFTIIDIYSLNWLWSTCMILLIIFYTAIEFTCNFYQIIVGNILYIFLISISQLTTSSLLIALQLKSLPKEFLACLSNVIVLFIQILLRKWIHNFYALLLRKNAIVLIVGIIYLIFLVANLLNYKIKFHIPVELFIIIIFFGILLCITLYNLQKEKEKAFEKTMDLKIRETYDSYYNDLIITLRKKQHEFNNHIQAILSISYSISSYDELIQVQSEYCNNIINSNKFFPLLSSDSPVISGFLFSKFQEADSKGININYSISSLKRITRIPEYIFVEILGILLDNAFEATIANNTNAVNINIYSEESKTIIVVSNPINDYQILSFPSNWNVYSSSKYGHSGFGIKKLMEYKLKYNFELELYIVQNKQDKIYKAKLSI